MSEDIFRKIIDEIAEVAPDTHTWLCFYGEPLIHKKSIFDRIKYAKHKGLKDVAINTNATLLDEEAAKRIIQSGLDRIHIGLDGMSAETYESIRVGARYNRVINNIECLLALKKKTPQVIINFIQQDSNQHETESFVKYWEKRVDRVFLKPIVTWTSEVETKLEGPTKRYPCPWVLLTLPITFDGNAALCGCDFDAKFIAGNVIAESIQSIWQGKLKRIRDAHIAGQYELVPAFCAKCEDWKSLKPVRCIAEAPKKTFKP
jgi:MoaA/NifB/PqqE/SkfB family radical SAM enzyme